MTSPRFPFRLKRSERWLQRLALIAMVVFVALGAYVLFYPTELLIAGFAILMLVTLALGVLVGLLAIYES